MEVLFSTVSSRHVVKHLTITHIQILCLTMAGMGGDQLEGHLEAIILVVVTGLISVWFTYGGVVHLYYAVCFPHACEQSTMSGGVEPRMGCLPSEQHAWLKSEEQQMLS